MKDKESNIVTNENDITNLLNYHFSTIGKSMAQKFTDQLVDPLRYINHNVVVSVRSISPGRNEFAGDGHDLADLPFFFTRIFFYDFFSLSLTCQ